MNSASQNLTSEDNLSLVAPAGCGKTESIAQAVRDVDGRQLILTHTHAGVRSLKQKLDKYNVPPNKYKLSTIDGWFLKWSASYPSMSGLVDSKPTNDIWVDVRNAINQLLSYSSIQRVITSSYNGVYVDEYQDCTLSQHKTILKLAELLPIRLVGDPLQGIMGFSKDPLVDWEIDVIPNFLPLRKLFVPWRWKSENPLLGTWLMNLRYNLINHNSIDLSSSPTINWIQLDPTRINSVTEYILRKPGTFVGIFMHAQQAHAFAKRFQGRVQSMEEMQCNDLLSYSKMFDETEGANLIRGFLKFIFICMVKADYLNNVERKLKSNRDLSFSNLENELLATCFQRLLTSRDYESMRIVLQQTLNNRTLKIHRRELMTEMSKAIEAMKTGEFDTLFDAAWAIRSNARRVGRNLYKALASRPALIKGLEFDNVLVGDSENLEGPKNFYVAVTRAIRSLTILSSDPMKFYKAEIPKHN